jgi:hypothetical protein
MEGDITGMIAALQNADMEERLAEANLAGAGPS